MFAVEFENSESFDLYLKINAQINGCAGQYLTMCEGVKDLESCTSFVSTDLGKFEFSLPDKISQWGIIIAMF